MDNRNLPFDGSCVPGVAGPLAPIVAATGPRAERTEALRRLRKLVESPSVFKSPDQERDAHQIALAPAQSWSPTRRPPRREQMRLPAPLFVDPEPGSDEDPLTWKLDSIVAEPSLGATAINMTYDLAHGTSAILSERARRMQYTEGGYEPAVADNLELDPRRLDFQFQPIEVVFTTPSGRERRLRPDVAVEFDDNVVRFGEIKASAAWFSAPVIRNRLARLERALVSEGLGPLMRIRGDQFTDDSVLSAHARIFGARLTPFDPSRDVNLVRAVIEANGGAAAMGLVADRLGLGFERALDRLAAMMLRRHVTFDLTALPTLATMVRLPRPARAFALRTLLARLADRSS